MFRQLRQALQHRQSRCEADILTQFPDICSRWLKELANDQRGDWQAIASDIRGRRRQGRRYRTRFDKHARNVFNQKVQLKENGASALNDTASVPDQDLNLGHGEGPTTECGCCFTECLTSQMSHCVENEEHLICKDCITAHARNLIGENKYEMKCFHTDGCTAFLSHAVREDMLGKALDATLTKIEQAAMLREAGIKDLVTCPFCHYAAVYPPVDRMKFFRCELPTCMQVSCRLCCAKCYHPKHTCDDDARRIRNDPRRTIEEAISDAIIRKCTNCGAQFVKEDGCNKVICTQCKTPHCYVCRQRIKDYNHFTEWDPDDERYEEKCPMYDIENAEDRQIAEARNARNAAQRQVLERRPDVDPSTLEVAVPETPAGNAAGHVHQPYVPPHPDGGWVEPGDEEFARQLYEQLNEPDLNPIDWQRYEQLGIFPPPGTYVPPIAEAQPQAQFQQVQDPTAPRPVNHLQVPLAQHRQAPPVNPEAQRAFERQLQIAIQPAAQIGERAPGAHLRQDDQQHRHVTQERTAINGPARAAFDFRYPENTEGRQTANERQLRRELREREFRELVVLVQQMQLRHRPGQPGLTAAHDHHGCQCGRDHEPARRNPPRDNDRDQYDRIRDRRDRRRNDGRRGDYGWDSDSDDESFGHRNRRGRGDGWDSDENDYYDRDDGWGDADAYRLRR